MPEYSAGTASVRIKPDASDFLRDLRAKLSSTKDPGFTISVGADTSKASRDTAAWIAEQQRRQVDVDVDPDTAKASAEMTVWRAKEEANPVNVRVVIQHEGANRELDRLQQRLQSFRRSDLLRLNVGAIGGAALQPAISGLAEVAAGIQQVAQAGLVIPGVIAGATASIGTLVLGLGGIKEAWDAASVASLRSGRDQETQARAAASASESLRNANVDLGQAYKDVARATHDAKQELQDLRIEQRGGMLDESRAILEAQKAREDLARGNYSDIRDAVLRVAEADQQLIETRSRNAATQDKLNDSNAKGVQGSDQVVSAQERLTRALQAVADAQTQAAAAADKMSAQQSKADVLLQRLSPNAQKLLSTFKEMRPEFQAFQGGIQDILTSGKAEEFRKLWDSMTPNLSTGLGSIAQGLNQNISAAVDSITSDQGKGIIDRILGNTGDAQGRLSAAIDPLIKGVGTLAAAGTDALPRLADGLTSVLTRFSNFVTEADKDGRLQKWIDDGIDGVTSLGNTVLNIGKSFTAITKAAGGGGSFLKWLQDATGRLQTFLNSTEGQNKLREYFAEGRQTLQEFIPVLKELPGLFESVGAGARTYVGGLLPILREVAELLGDHPELVKYAVAAYLAFNTVSPIMKNVQNAIGNLGSGLTNLGTGFASTRQRAQDEMTRTAKAFDDAGGPKGVGKFSGALSAVGAAGGPLLSLVGAAGIPLLVAALDTLNHKHQEAAAAAKQLDDAEKALETTLDRVTGKITGATRDQAIASARTYDTTGAAGGGVPGISKGDALNAATSLGIPPDVYADALIGKPDALQKVRQILLGNNLNPELASNQNLSKVIGDLGSASGGKITQELTSRALIGDPDALKQFTDALASVSTTTQSGIASTYGLRGVTLTDIAQALSPTGQASVLSGGNLNRTLAAIPGAQQGVTTTNQAQFGRFRLSPAGGGFFGQGAQVGATGPAGDPNTQFKITSPSTPGLLAELQASGIPFITNSDGSITATVPGSSPYIEKYAKGGPTRGDRRQGFLAELHGQEWVHDADTVDYYGRAAMNALWRKQVDPKALKGLIPGFDGGGPTDPNGGNFNPGIQIDTSHASVYDPSRLNWRDLKRLLAPPPGLIGRAATELPGFDWGGPTDPNDPNYQQHLGTGAPPGPGPAPVAPNPFGTNGSGQLDAISNSLLAGAQGPVNNLTNLLQSLPAGQQGSTPGATAASTLLGGLIPGLNLNLGGQQGGQKGPLPGLFGLMQAGSDPAQQQAWMAQTGDWLSNWGANTALGFGKSLLSGVLGFFGAEGLMSSPYLQAAGQAVSHFGNVAMQLGGGGPQLPASSYVVTLPNGQTVDLAALPGSTPGLPGAATGVTGALAPGGISFGANPASKAGFGGDSPPTITPDLLSSKGISPLYSWGSNDAARRSPDWVNQLAGQFGLVASTYSNGDTLHQGGFAWDFNDPEAAKGAWSPKLDAFAQYIQDNLSGQTLQLIHSNPNSGQKWGIAAGSPVGPGTGAPGYFADDWGGHGDHVHWATDAPVLVNPTATSASPATGSPKAFDNFLKQLYGSPSGLPPGAGASSSALSGIKAKAYQMYIAAGMPPGEWGDFDQLIANESGWDPTNKNPKSTAAGLGQFLDSTRAQYGIGLDATPEQQLTAIFQYLRDRSDYKGSPAEAWRLWQERGAAGNAWYDAGGWLPPGATFAVNKTGLPEPVLTHPQGKAIQAIAKQITRPTPTPPPRGPDARQMIPQPAFLKLLPAPVGPPAAAPPPPGQATPPPPPVTTPAPSATTPGQDTGPPPSKIDHTLPWINTAIDSTAQVGANIASQAIGALGGGGGIGLPGAGAIGQFVGGLILEGGKVAKGVANVVSSALVGTWTPGTQASQYGATLRPDQNVPQTPQDNRRTYIMNGLDGRNIVDRMRLKDSQDTQTQLATYG